MKSYTAHVLPQYALEYVTSVWTEQRRVTLTHDGQGNWTLKGDLREVTVKARSADDARQRIKEEIGRLDGRTDRRRSQWFYT